VSLFPAGLASGAKEAAEELGISDEFGGRHPSGAEAHVDSIAFVARLKSCPFKAMSFSAACKADVYFPAHAARLNRLMKKSNIEAEFSETSLRG
jgi:hypothetical protein